MAGARRGSASVTNSRMVRWSALSSNSGSFARKDGDCCSVDTGDMRSDVDCAICDSDRTEGCSGSTWTIVVAGEGGRGSDSVNVGDAGCGCTGCTTAFSIISDPSGFCTGSSPRACENSDSCIGGSLFTAISCSSLCALGISTIVSIPRCGFCVARVFITVLAVNMLLSAFVDVITRGSAT